MSRNLNKQIHKLIGAFLFRLDELPEECKLDKDGSDSGIIIAQWAVDVFICMFGLLLPG